MTILARKNIRGVPSFAIVAVVRHLGSRSERLQLQGQGDYEYAARQGEGSAKNIRPDDGT
jgi:hypothetical protein